MIKVLLAGGAGFLGSHIAEMLVDKGYEVTVVDNLASGRLSNLENIADKIEFVESDILDLEYSEEVNYLLNFASRASRKEWEEFPVEVALSNSEGSNNLIKIALKNKARYIFASSSEIYGNPDLVPTPEDYLGRVSSTASRSPYDEGKRFGEALTKAYEREYNLDNVILRLFNTYGPRMRGGDLYGRVIDRFIQQAISNKDLTVYGKGDQTRSFTYVSDVVSAVVCLMEQAKKGAVLNLGGSEEIKIIDLANLIIKLTESISKIKFLSLPEHDPSRRAADARAIRSFGWAPEVSLEEGLKRTIKFYGKN